MARRANTSSHYEERPVVTDADGRFEFTELPAQNDTVVASEHRLHQLVAVAPEETVDLTLRVGSATLKGTVVRGRVASGDFCRSAFSRQRRRVRGPD